VLSLTRVRRRAQTTVLVTSFTFFSRVMESEKAAIGLFVTLVPPTKNYGDGSNQSGLLPFAVFQAAAMFQVADFGG
jgi:hypothetical protein